MCWATIIWSRQFSRCIQEKKCVNGGCQKQQRAALLATVEGLIPMRSIKIISIEQHIGIRSILNHPKRGMLIRSFVDALVPSSRQQTWDLIFFVCHSAISSGFLFISGGKKNLVSSSKVANWIASQLARLPIWLQWTHSQHGFLQSFVF